MKAIILAAGYATRLYPITLEKPKPLLTIAGKPLLTYLIEKMQSLNEIEHVYVISNAKFFSHFQEWKNSLKTNLKITIINDLTLKEEDKLGAVGEIEFALNSAKISEDVLVLGGDNLFEDNLKEMFNLFKKQNSSLTAIKNIDDIEIAKRCSCVELNKENKIIRFAEKPKEPFSTLVSTLIYIIKKSDIPHVSELIKTSNKKEEIKAGELIEYLTKKSNVYGYILNGSWFDIGTEDQLRKANEYFKEIPCILT